MQEEVKKALEVLRKGGVILYPTDTIWGIGCDATNKEAVDRIYKIKQRADSKSMLVLVDHASKLSSYLDEVPDVAWDLIELSEKPITIIYSGAKNLAPNLVAQDGSVGIRVTKERFSNALCRQFRCPVVSTSANISGAPSPQNFSEIDSHILDQVDYVVNFRQEEKSNPAPSSIIKLGVSGEVTIIRE
jgi:L-threonylcarbamoyladenylate synthase